MVALIECLAVSGAVGLLVGPTGGAIFFAEVPDLRSLIGALFVVSGAFLLGVSRTPPGSQATGPAA